ncbi:oligosaccharide flippase family protein [Rhodobacteraceae bacterium NNCM2]|nr:oligosaccharide flippase family protein [Coraliihabitans acroporae]
MIRQFFTNVGALVFARAYLAASQIIALPIIARNVAVEDFAVMALAMTVILFGTVLSDGGLGRSLIRIKEYDPDEWSSVFWLLVGVGLALALMVILAAPLWAWLFESERLIIVMIALAAFPFLQSVAAVPSAELERREKYQLLAIVQIIATTGSLGLAIVLALGGFGIWALVWQQISLAGVRLAGLWAVTRFRPTLIFSWQLVKSHQNFARDSIGASLISILDTQIAVIVIGRVLGQVPLGLFAMTQRFTRLPMYGLAGPASSVVYVRMARVKEEAGRVIEIYYASIRLLAFALIAPLAIISISGNAIFVTILSAEWSKVAPLFAMIVPGFTIDAIASVCLGCVFRALGRTDLHVRLVFEGTVLRAVLVCSAVWVGLEAVALTFTLWSAAMVLRGWVLARRCAPLEIGKCLSAVAGPALCAAIVGVLHFVIVQAIGPSHVVEIALAITSCLVAYALTFALNRRALLSDIRQFQT